MTYPTEHAGSLSIAFPTTCFASDLGLLETRISPPVGRSGFGLAVALDGDRLAVGTGVDGVQTYRGNGLTWKEEMFVAPPASDGESVRIIALSGDALVVGFPFDTEAGSQAGAVYAFRLGTGTATLERKLLPNAPGADLEFGSSIALDGQTLAIASKKDVVLFERGAGSWPDSQRLVPDIPVQTDPGSVFVSVALHGDLFAVGATWSVANSDGGAIFLYRRTAGAFVFDSRIDPDVPSASFGQISTLGEGLIVAETNPTSVYSSSGVGWALEARLGSGGLGQTAIDGTRIAINTGQAVQLFERAGGAWPLLQTVAPHDVSAPGYGAVDLLGDVLAMGNSESDGNGVGAGAVYTYAKATAPASPDCALSRTGPARIDGIGTDCVEPGTGDAQCPYATVGTSTVFGMTPYGGIAFPFVWTNFTDGFTRSSELELSSVAPLRDGTSPKLSFSLDGFTLPVVRQDIPATFTLDLCRRSVTVDGVVQLDQAALDDNGRALPLVGSIVIDHDGWAVRGHFRTDALCHRSRSGP